MRSASIAMHSFRQTEIIAERHAHSFPCTRRSRLGAFRQFAIIEHSEHFLLLPRGTSRIVHTPVGFTPGHLRPEPLADGTLAFAFRGDKLLVSSAPNAPTLPDFATSQR